MEMTINDICNSYRLAKNQKEQIEVLADLNGCTKDIIIAILRSEGLMPMSYTAPEAVIQLANDRYMAAGIEISHYEAEIKKLQESMELLVMEQKDIKRFLNGIRKETK